MPKPKRVGVLTGGGDAPGLNPAIKGLVYRGSELGVGVVGVPKTIDKDLAETDYTLGFDTALRNVSEVIERSRTPAGSHGWVQIVEVMGRHAGHLALWSGVAGQAHIVLIPEHPFRYERVFQLLTKRLGEPGLSRGRSARPRHAGIVVAEGARAEGGELITIDDHQDAFGHARLGGIGVVLPRKIVREAPYESRAVLLC